MDLCRRMSDWNCKLGSVDLRAGLDSNLARNKTVKVETNTVQTYLKVTPAQWEECSRIFEAAYREYSWLQLRLNIACCVAFAESSAEVLRTHASYLRTFAFVSGREVFTFRRSVVIPQYFPWILHNTQCSNATEMCRLERRNRRRLGLPHFNSQLCAAADRSIVPWEGSGVVKYYLAQIFSCKFLSSETIQQCHLDITITLGLHKE